MTAACTITNLSAAYGNSLVLDRVNLEVPTGIVMGVVGPNGAGKSTLIKAMLGLITPLAGHSAFFGEPLKLVRNRVGYVPQTSEVDWDFPATVLDVVTMGTYGRLGWIRRPRKSHRALVQSALAETGIDDLADRPIGALSGGQRQRVFLARALAGEPDLLVMDEPFQGLDAVSQEAIVRVLHALRAEGKTIVMVHHDLATVGTYCDEVTLLNRHVIAAGPVEAVYTQANIQRTYLLPDTDVPPLGGPR